jgi:hypothetical protein
VPVTVTPLSALSQSTLLAAAPTPPGPNCAPARTPVEISTKVITWRESLWMDMEVESGGLCHSFKSVVEAGISIKTFNAPLKT